MKNFFLNSLKVGGFATALGLTAAGFAPDTVVPQKTISHANTNLVSYDPSLVSIGSFGEVGHRQVNTPRAFDLLQQSQKARYGSTQATMSYMGLGITGDKAALERINQFEKWARLTSQGPNGSKLTPVLGLQTFEGLDNSKLSQVFSTSNPEFQALNESFKRLNEEGIDVRVRFLSESNLKSNPYTANVPGGVDNYKSAARFFRDNTPSNVKLGFSPAIGGQGFGIDPAKLYEPGVYDYIGGTLYSKNPTQEYSGYYNKMNKLAKDMPFQLDEFGGSIHSKENTLSFLKKAKTNFPNLENVMLFDAPMRSASAKAKGYLGFTQNGQSYVPTVIDTEGRSVLNFGQKTVSKTVTNITNKIIPNTSPAFGGGVATGIGLAGAGSLLRRRRKRTSVEKIQEARQLPEAPDPPAPSNQIVPPQAPSAPPATANDILSGTQIGGTPESRQTQQRKRKVKIKDDKARVTAEAAQEARRLKREAVYERRRKAKYASNRGSRPNHLDGTPNIHFTPEGLRLHRSRLAQDLDGFDKTTKKRILPLKERARILREGRKYLSVEDHLLDLEQFTYKRSAQTLDFGLDSRMIGSEYREIIQEAFSNGKKIPIHVLKSFPTLAPELLTRAQWEEAEMLGHVSGDYDTAVENSRKRKQAKAQASINSPSMEISEASRPSGGDGLEAHEPIPKATKQAVVEAADTVKRAKEIPKASAKSSAAKEIPKTAKAATRAVKNLASKTKLSTLTKAGLLGVGAAGLYAFLGSSDGARKRNGIVREHPENRDNQLSSATFVGAAAIGTAILAKRLNPTVRAFLGIGGALGIGATVVKKDDPSVAVLGLTAAGAVAAIAVAFTRKNSVAGLKAVRDFGAKHGAKATVDGISNALKDVTHNFPAVKSLLSREGATALAGLVTLPMAHSLISKHLEAEGRRYPDHTEVAFLPSWQQNNAGSTDRRKSNAPLVASNPSSVTDVNFSGSVRTYYDSSQALGEI